MLEIKKIVCNDFQVNTYIVYDETKQAIIIDPGCYNKAEEKELEDFIKNNDLEPKYIVNTHAHIDHIIGNAFCKKTYDIPLIAHPESIDFYKSSFEMALAFGFQMEETLFPDEFFDEGNTLDFGQSSLKILSVPGHANGSLALYSKKDKLVFVGDVLFSGSIGRTDLPTGNHALLLQMIEEKIFTLDDEVRVFPGHGEETTVKKEKQSNPFFV
jgi:hydroxyacylglutathione hydrolase